MNKRFLTAVVAGFVLATAASASAANLEEVQRRGELRVAADPRRASLTSLRAMRSTWASRPIWPGRSRRNSA